MLMFDIESLGTESNCVILSAAIIRFEVEEHPTFQNLLDEALFVKFDAKEQAERYHRTVDKDTLFWWSEQDSAAKEMSLLPKPDDLSAVEGCILLSEYIKNTPNKRSQIIWSRGSLDQMASESLSKSVNQEPMISYGRWRDMRTAIDLMYGSSTGYVEVEKEGFDRSMVIKHNPVHDCALDVMMLLYGKAK